MGANNQGVAPCDAYVNLSDADDVAISQWTYTDIQFNISLISRSVILIVGMAGNGAFLIVIARVRSMRTLVNFYLMHLAVADILVLLQHTAVPLTNYAALRVPSSGHLFGSGGCMAMEFFNYVGYFTSIILVCLMSFERFLAVCHPLKHHSINTRGRASKLIACAWLVGVLFSACAIPIRAVHTKTCIEWPTEERFLGYPSYVGRCTPAAEWTSYVFDVVQAVPFFSALIGNTVFFTKIVRNLRGRQGMERDRRSLQGRRVARITHQVTKMLIINGVVFFICHAPFQFLSLCSLIATLAKLPLFSSTVAESILTTAFRILVFVNSAVNPIVYNASNARYRKAFVRVFACSSRARARASHSTTVAATVMAANHSVMGLDEIGRQNSQGSMANGVHSNGFSQYSQLTKL